MFLKSAILLCAAVVLILEASGKTCSSGQYYQAVRNKRCEIQCGPEKCICSDEPSNSSEQFDSCLQKCQHSVTGKNVSVTNCPDMKCTNLDTCFQTCGTDNCSMECKAKKTCNQECGDGCVKVVCSADRCYQDCYNCTLECTSDTEYCRHYCTGGVCYSKCAAQKCDRECMSGVADCKIIAINSSSKQTMVPGLYLVFQLLLIFLLSFNYESCF